MSAGFVIMHAVPVGRIAPACVRVFHLAIHTFVYQKRFR